MSLDLYDLRSELTDRNALEFERKAISYLPGDINHLIKHHKEKLEHYSAKSILFYILQEYNHDVLTEFEIVGVGRGDVFDLTTKVQYELETSHSPKYRREINSKYLQSGVELIVIDCSDLPPDFYQVYMYLKQFVQPD
jgi:hypothetical protein